MKNHREKLVYLSFIMITLGVFIVLGFFYYSFSKFQIGELVYKKNGGIMIGEVQGVSLPFNYLVQWQDESYTKESAFSINSISKLGNLEIKEALEKQKDKESFDFYSKDVKGEIVASEDLKDLSEAEVSGIIPGGEGGLSIIKLGKEDCTPSFICGKWQECQSEYDLHLLVTEGIVSGIQYRYCKDSKECMADFIDSRTCSKKEEIEIKKKTINGEDYLEIYNSEGRVVGSLKETQLENLKKLDIGFFI